MKSSDTTPLGNWYKGHWSWDQDSFSILVVPENPFWFLVRLPVALGPTAFLLCLKNAGGRKFFVSTKRNVELLENWILHLSQWRWKGGCWPLMGLDMSGEYYFPVAMAKPGDQGNLKKKEFNRFLGLGACPQGQQQGRCASKHGKLKVCILYQKHKVNRKHGKSTNTHSLHPVISSIKASQTPQTMPPTGNQMSNHLSLWGDIFHSSTTIWFILN